MLISPVKCKWIKWMNGMINAMNHAMNEWDEYDIMEPWRNHFFLHCYRMFMRSITSYSKVYEHVAIQHGAFFSFLFHISMMTGTNRKSNRIKIKMSSNHAMQLNNKLNIPAYQMNWITEPLFKWTEDPGIKWTEELGIKWAVPDTETKYHI